MQLSNPKYKEWKKKSDFKKWLHNYKRFYRRLKKRKFRKKNIEQFSLPVNLSLINNFDEVLGVLNHIKDYMRKSQPKTDEIFLDMSNTTSITVDALMYLLVFLKNSKRHPDNHFNIRGNVPNDPKSRDLVKQSGFLDFLKTNQPIHSTPTDNVKIYKGNEVNGLVFGEICDFIHDKLKCDRISTKELYNSLGEIVGNSNEHAYSNNRSRWAKWLTFARFKGDFVIIVIMDTGLGIIDTINKKWGERFIGDHKALLESAMAGHFRSQTKDLYRNKGLPRIRENALKGVLQNLVLITNDVKYTIKNENVNIKENYSLLNSELKGTLYYFEFKKEEATQ